MRTTWLLLVLALVAPVPGTACAGKRAAHAVERPTTATSVFTCGMHPEIEAEGPGICPICGMDLVPAPQDGVYGAQAAPLPRVTFPCAPGLSCAPSEESVAALITAALRSDDGFVRGLAVPAIGDAAALRAELADRDGFVRQAAAIEVARRGDRGALPDLVLASSRDGLDPQGLSRIFALDARLALGDSGATAELRAWMGHEDLVTRSTAAGVAGTHGVLREELLSRWRSDSDAFVRDAALLSLAQTGEEEAVAAIADRWDRQTWSIHARLDPVKTRPRMLRTVALSAAPPPEGGFAVNLWAMDREMAALALVELGDPSGPAILRDLLARLGAGEFDINQGFDVPGQALVLLQHLWLHAPHTDPSVVEPWLRRSEELLRLQAAVTWTRLRAGSDPG